MVARAFGLPSPQCLQTMTEGALASHLWSPEFWRISCISSAFLSPRSLRRFNPQCCRNQQMLKAGHLLTIYQECWESGKIFADWKPASIIPMPDNGVRENPRNYRPIILTSATGKVLEKIVLGATERHFKKKKIRHRMDSQRECSAVVISSLSVIKSPVGRWRESDGHNNCGFC